MEFIDTQIISYKFKNNRELFDGDIKGRQISSIVALEFLGIMMKNENKAIHAIEVMIWVTEDCLQICLSRLHDMCQNARNGISTMVFVGKRMWGRLRLWNLVKT